MPGLCIMKSQCFSHLNNQSTNNNSKLGSHGMYLNPKDREANLWGTLDCLQCLFLKVPDLKKKLSLRTKWIDPDK